MDSTICSAANLLDIPKVSSANKLKSIQNKKNNQLKKKQKSPHTFQFDLQELDQFP
jgi:hypothetical protein